jgi:hypothetical protein
MSEKITWTANFGTAELTDRAIASVRTGDEIADNIIANLERRLNASADKVDSLREQLRVAQERIQNAIPENWLDPLLTGPDAVLRDPPWNCPDIERLLNAIRKRLTPPAESTEGKT